MPAITAMTPQVRRQGRLSIEVDDAFWRGASMEAIVEVGLRVGQQLDEAGLEQVGLALDERAAFESALRILAARGRTADEIRDRLARKDVSPEMAERVLERLAALSLLDDGAVLRSRAESLAARGAGRRRAATELGRLVSERDLVEEVLDEVFAEEDSAERAAAALARHARPERLADQPARQRALAWLLRQGHAMDDARAAIAALPELERAEPGEREAQRRPTIEAEELDRQIGRRFPKAAGGDHRDRQRAQGWAARRGVGFDELRACLERLAEAG